MAKLAFLISDMGGGGAERVTASLVNGAVRRGHQVHLLLMRPEGANLALVHPSVRIINLRANRIRNVIRPLVRYLRREGPRALQVSMWPLTIAAIIAVRLASTGTRLITTDHITLSRQYGFSSLQLATLTSSLRFFYPLADHRTAVSKGSARELARLSGVSVETIYNPIAPVQPMSDVIAAWPHGKRRLLSVGTLKNQKNQLLLLNALSRVAQSVDAALVILGEGDRRGMLERRVIELGLQDLVSLPGYVADPSSYYGSAELFVLSSDYEGFGNVIVEALSAGLAVVSTDCPDGPAEILDGGRYGALVPPGDSLALAIAIERALAEPPQPKRQRARAAQFGEDAAIDRYLELMLGPVLE